MEKMEKKFKFLDLGGRFKPKNCVSRHRVAIIVPYRDREEHLRTFLNHMHSFLPRQQLDYGIFIVEQAQWAQIIKKFHYCTVGKNSHFWRIKICQHLKFHDLKVT